MKSLPELALAEQVDVADDPAFVAFIDKAIATLGGLDCLVNNAGIAGPTAPIEQIDPAAWSARWFSC